MAKPRIAILTLAIGADYKRNLAICLESKRKYAEKHGYTYFEGGQEYWDRERPIAWSKIRFWQHILKEYAGQFDYLWISDADVLITNLDLKLEDHVLPLMPAEADLMMNYDSCHHINSGNMIVRPGKWFEQFLDNVWNRKEAIYHIWWENKAMIDEYEENKDAQCKIFINKENHRFNAYIGGHKGERLWQPGDLLVHFAGIYDSQKIKELCQGISAGKVPRVNFFPDE
jgi:hypothetical protein